MPQFDITARLQIEGPANIAPVVSSIRKQLGGIAADVDVRVSPAASRGISSLSSDAKSLQSSLSGVRRQAAAMNAAMSKTRLSSDAARQFQELNRQIAATSRQLQATQKATGGAANEMFRFGEQIGLAFRRFLAFQIGAILGIARLASSIGDAAREAAEFQKTMIGLSQLGSTGREVSEIGKAVSDLSQTMGVSSKELSEATIYLKGAGMSAEEVRASLEALAKTSLSPTFDSIRDTTEAIIAMRQQFGVGASDIEKYLGTINQVSKEFAAESEDMVTAVRRAGAAFKAASSDSQSSEETFRQFISLFTAVRSTTRESADEISSGLRTIFGRLQSNEVADNLKDLGINLRYTAEEASLAGRDIKGEFVGAWEAVRRLHDALGNVPTTDPRYAAIVQQVGGFRQISRVIPLIQQQGLALRAYATAQTGANSLTRDAEKAQGSFLVQLGRVREEFLGLVRDLGNNRSLQQLGQIFIGVAETIINVGKALQPVLPMLAALAAIKIGRAITTSIFPGVRNILGAGLATTPAASPTVAKPPGLRSGGAVPGSGTGDIVHAMLPANSFVIKRDSVRRAGGHDALRRRVDAGGKGSDNRSRDVRVRLEPQEHVFMPHEARRIGYGNLRRLNRTGKLPRERRGYATGGAVRGVFVPNLEDVEKPMPFAVGGRLGRRLTPTVERIEGRGVESPITPGPSVGKTVRKPPKATIPRSPDNNQVRIKCNKFNDMDGEGRGYAAGGETPSPLDASSSIGDPVVRENFQRLFAGEHGDRIQGHLPEGSKFLAHGLDAVVFRRPDGDVVRIGGLGVEKFRAQGRPADADLMVQPKETSRYGHHMVERLPYKPSIRDVLGERADDPRFVRRVWRAFDRRAKRRGKYSIDALPKNLHYDPTVPGRLVAIDPRVYVNKLGHDEPTADFARPSEMSLPGISMGMPPLPPLSDIGEPSPSIATAMRPITPRSATGDFPPGYAGGGVLAGWDSIGEPEPHRPANQPHRMASVGEFLRSIGKEKLPVHELVGKISHDADDSSFGELPRTISGYYTPPEGGKGASVGIRHDPSPRTFEYTIGHELLGHAVDYETHVKEHGKPGYQSDVPGTPFHAIAQAGLTEWSRFQGDRYKPDKHNRESFAHAVGTYHEELASHGGDRDAMLKSHRHPVMQGIFESVDKLYHPEVERVLGFADGGIIRTPKGPVKLAREGYYYRLDEVSLGQGKKKPLGVSSSNAQNVRLRRVLADPETGELTPKSKWYARHRQARNAAMLRDPERLAKYIEQVERTRAARHTLGGTVNVVRIGTPSHMNVKTHIMGSFHTPAYAGGGEIEDWRLGDFARAHHLHFGEETLKEFGGRRTEKIPGTDLRVVPQKQRTTALLSEIGYNPPAGVGNVSNTKIGNLPDLTDRHRERLRAIQARAAGAGTDIGRIAPIPTGGASQTQEARDTALALPAGVQRMIEEVRDAENSEGTSLLRQRHIDAIRRASPAKGHDPTESQLSRSQTVTAIRRIRETAKVRRGELLPEENLSDTPHRPGSRATTTIFSEDPTIHGATVQPDIDEIIDRLDQHFEEQARQRKLAANAPKTLVAMESAADIAQRQVDEPPPTARRRPRIGTRVGAARGHFPTIAEAMSPPASIPDIGRIIPEGGPIIRSSDVEGFSSPYPRRFPPVATLPAAHLPPEQQLTHIEEQQEGFEQHRTLAATFPPAQRQSQLARLDVAARHLQAAHKDVSSRLPKPAAVVSPLAEAMTPTPPATPVIATIRPTQAPTAAPEAIAAHEVRAPRIAGDPSKYTRETGKQIDKRLRRGASKNSRGRYVYGGAIYENPDRYAAYEARAKEIGIKTTRVKQYVSSSHPDYHPEENPHVAGRKTKAGGRRRLPKPAAVVSPLAEALTPTPSATPVIATIRPTQAPTAAPEAIAAHEVRAPRIAGDPIDRRAKTEAGGGGRPPRKRRAASAPGDDDSSRPAGDSRLLRELLSGIRQLTVEMKSVVKNTGTMAKATPTPQASPTAAVRSPVSPVTPIEADSEAFIRERLPRTKHKTEFGEQLARRIQVEDFRGQGYISPAEAASQIERRTAEVAAKAKERAAALAKVEREVADLHQSFNTRGRNRIPGRRDTDVRSIPGNVAEIARQDKIAVPLTEIRSLGTGRSTTGRMTRVEYELARIQSRSGTSKSAVAKIEELNKQASRNDLPRVYPGPGRITTMRAAHIRPIDLSGRSGAVADLATRQEVRRAQQELAEGRAEANRRAIERDRVAASQSTTKELRSLRGGPPSPLTDTGMVAGRYAALAADRATLRERRKNPLPTPGFSGSERTARKAPDRSLRLQVKDFVDTRVAAQGPMTADAEAVFRKRLQRQALQELQGNDVLAARQRTSVTTPESGRKRLRQIIRTEAAPTKPPTLRERLKFLRPDTEVNPSSIDFGRQSRTPTGRGIVRRSLGFVGRHATETGLIGAAFAPQILQNSFGTVDAPRGSVEGSKQAAGVGGAIQLGAIGGQLGSAFGPVGAGIGGIVGLIYGYTSTLKEADDHLKEIDFQKSFAPLQDSLAFAANSTEKLGTSVNQKIADFLSTANREASRRSESEGGGANFFDRNVGKDTFLGRSISTAANVATGVVTRPLGIDKLLPNDLIFNDTQTIERRNAEQIAKHRRDILEPQIPQLQQLGERIASETKLPPELVTARQGATQGELEENRQSRIEKFQGAGGKQIAQTIADFKGIPVRQVYEQFDRVAVSSNRLRLQQENQEKAIAAATIDINKFQGIGDAIRAASGSLHGLQAEAANLSSIFEGQVATARVGGSSQAVGNIGGPDREAFRQGVAFTTGQIGGPAIGEFGGLVTELDRAMRELPSAISHAPLKFGDEDAFKGGVVNTFGDKGGGINLPLAIRQRLATAVEGTDTERLQKDARANPQKLVEDLIRQAFGDIDKVFEDVTKQLEERANEFSQGLTTYSQMLQRTGESRDRESQASLTVTRARAAVVGARTGRDPDELITLRQALRPARARQERLAGEDAFNPEAIGTRLASKTGLANDIQRKINNVQRQPVDQRNSLSSLIRDFDAASREASNLQQALQHLADSSDETAAIQDRLNQLEKQRQGQLSFTERLITADPKQLFEMQHGAQASDVAVQQGSFRGFNPRDIQAALEHLRSLQDVRLPGYGNRTGGQVAERLLTGANRDVFGKQATQVEGQQDQLLQQQLKVAETAAQAQEQLTKQFASTSNAFLANLERQNSQFLQKMDTLIHSNLLKGASGAEDSALVVRNEKQQTVDKIVGLQRGTGVPIATLKGIVNNPEFEDFRNARTQVAKIASARQRLFGKEGVGGSPRVVGELDEEEKNTPDSVFGHKFTGITGGDTSDKVKDQLRQQLFRAAPDIAERTHGALNREQVERDVVSHVIGSFDKFRTDSGTRPDQKFDVRSSLKSAIDSALNIVEGPQKEKLRTSQDAVSKGAFGPDAGTLGPQQRTIEGVADNYDEVRKSLDGLRTGADTLEQALKDAAVATTAYETARSVREATETAAPPASPVVTRASGGVIFRPKGTDTVPAMLTPGEFVVNAAASRRNMPMLQQINAGARYYEEGGAVDDLDAVIANIPSAIIPYGQQLGSVEDQEKASGQPLISEPIRENKKIPAAIKERMAAAELATRRRTQYQEKTLVPALDDAVASDTAASEGRRQAALGQASEYTARAATRQRDILASIGRSVPDTADVSVPTPPAAQPPPPIDRDTKVPFYGLPASRLEASGYVRTRRGRATPPPVAQPPPPVEENANFAFYGLPAGRTRRDNVPAPPAVQPPPPIAGGGESLEVRRHPTVRFDRDTNAYLTNVRRNINLSREQLSTPDALDDASRTRSTLQGRAEHYRKRKMPAHAGVVSAILMSLDESPIGKQIERRASGGPSSIPFVGTALASASPAASGGVGRGSRGGGAGRRSISTGRRRRGGGITGAERLAYENEVFGPPVNFASGGMVPTMTSPGEFVVNSAAAAANPGILKQINSGRAPAYRQAGGPVGAASSPSSPQITLGSEVKGTLDGFIGKFSDVVGGMGNTLGQVSSSFSSLASSLGGFNDAASSLARSLSNSSIPSKIEVTTKNDFVVTMSGAGVMAAMKGDMVEAAVAAIMQQLPDQVRKAVESMPPRG